MHRVLLSILIAALGVSAGELRTHSLQGRVLDPSASAVPQSTVRLYSRDTSAERTVITNAQGAFSFLNVPEGDYLLEARTAGLDQSSPLAVSLSADSNVDLKLEIRGLASRVTVTATASPQATFESGKALDIVDNAEIARREEFSVVEALRSVAGLRVQQLGGPGSFARIQTRGLRAADTGLLIDGVRLRDAASVQGDATAFLGDLQLVNTDRLEVLRGLGSSLYGTNTTGGVINLVTDQGGGKLRGEIGGEAGGLGLARGQAKLAGGLFNDRLQYSAGLAHLNVRGGIDGVEHVRNSSGQGYALFRPTSTSSLSARILGTLSNVGVNSSPFAAYTVPASGVIPAIGLDHSQILLADQGKPFSWGNATFAPNLYDPDARRIGDVRSTLVQWNQQAGSRVNYRVSYQNTLTNRDNRDGAAGQGYQPMFNSVSLFSGRLDTIQARADVELARWNTFTAGFEWEREYYDNLSKDLNPDPSQRVNADANAHQQTRAFFAQDRLKFLSDRLQIALAGRFSNFALSQPKFTGGDQPYSGVRFDAPPDAYTGDIAISYFLPKSSTKLRTHAGNGYRSPTLYERLGTSFYWGSFSPLGDPRLRPERTVSFDAGVDQYFANSRYRLSASYFYTRLQEVVGYAGLSNDLYGRWGGYVNMGGALSRGIELSVEARPYRSLTLISSYTYTNADERRSGLIGGDLRAIRVFPQMFSVVATQQLTKRLQLTSDFLAASDYISGSFFVGSGNRPYQFAGPRKLDAALNYTLPLGENRSLRFYTRMENLLNQTYYEDGFRTPKAWATAGIRYAF